MWILTQNGKRILSTEGMDEINVADPAEGKTDYAVMIRRKTDGKAFALGFYNKKERAADVIKQIFNIQSDYILCDGKTDAAKGVYQPGYVVIPPKTFQMPADMDSSFEGEKRYVG